MRGHGDLNEAAGEGSGEGVAAPSAIEGVALRADGSSAALLLGAGAEPWGRGKRISVAMLVPGLGLLWLVPAVGCLLLVAAGFALAITSEADLAR